MGAVRDRLPLGRAEKPIHPRGAVGGPYARAGLAAEHGEGDFGLRRPALRRTHRRKLRRMTATREGGARSSEELFARAVELMPGGVNSPVRAFRGVGGTPRFIASASGATLTDVDGRTYVDYVGSWGPMILGHADDQGVA